MFNVEAIGHVISSRLRPDDDDWGAHASVIELAPAFGEEALLGLDGFSHIEVLFVFDRVVPEQIVRGARHPRNNPDWPLTGIFAQRAKMRPNRIGSTIARLVGVAGRQLHVLELDAIDGTPVIDIKPVMAGFLPRTPVIQPAWAGELMRAYWDVPG